MSGFGIKHLTFMPGESKSKHLYVLWFSMSLCTKSIVLMLVVRMTIFPPFMSMVLARIPRSVGTVSSSRTAVSRMVRMLSILSCVTSPRSFLKMTALNTGFGGVSSAGSGSAVCVPVVAGVRVT